MEWNAGVVMKSPHSCVGGVSALHHVAKPHKQLRDRAGQRLSDYCGVILRAAAVDESASALVSNPPPTGTCQHRSNAEPVPNLPSYNRDQPSLGYRRPPAERTLTTPSIFLVHLTTCGSTPVHVNSQPRLHYFR